MGTTANLTNEVEQLASGVDNIVIVQNISDIPGGRTLDVTGFTPATINAGHVIIRNTATDVYKPMPLKNDDTEYDDLPASHEYAGILIATIKTNRPFAAILTRGVVNPEAMVIPITGILTAVKAALPLIQFRADS